VFADEDVANAARDAGLGTEVEPWEVEESVPGPVTVYGAVAHLERGVDEMLAVKAWPIDLPNHQLDELRMLASGKRWVCRSLDREKAVAAVTEALAARRRELGVPNA
jgi:hypothetical protein